MDRNSAIGLTLIAALLLAYFYWFSPKPAPGAKEPVTQEVNPPAIATDTITAETPVAVPDSILSSDYGDLSVLLKGTESMTRIETQDLDISFSNHGGVIKTLELKNYKTYYKEPLKLITPVTTSFQLKSAFKGKEVDFYDLYYNVQQQKTGDSTILVFSIALNDGFSLSQRYAIPDKGFIIPYHIEGKGLDQDLSSDQVNLSWRQTILPTEKSLTDTRNQTTINYYSESGGFNKLSERSNDTQHEVFPGPQKWLAIKQKYFLSALIADNVFNAGEIEISTNPQDTSVVKVANVNIALAKQDLAKGKADFKYYLGPNDYQIIGKVAEKFSRNVYLGWPPVYWVNKFVIFPVFHFLTLHIGNFGIIIIILVILLKLVLAPLSYRSYLSMAKMKVLKPELDAIKEKNGDDASKVQQEQLKLYQQVGVNPISGCIPVVLQMPILFAMFYLFPASIELRQQPLLWAEDLSTYDSVIHFALAIPFIGNHISLFTLMMTLSTLIYTWQNNQLSSVQGPMKSMSYIMPLIFFFVLNSFSAGLTFYYFVSNLVTFGQQAIIRKFVNEDKIKGILEENRKKNLGGGKKSKFMAKLEEAMKASEEARKSSSDARKKKKK
jgi:YidC/Oxa1 family membrane protein insertase